MAEDFIRPMWCDIDLDWCTYICPCGQSLCTRHESDEAIALWKESHKDHTNGKCILHTTPDGMRAWGNQSVPDEEVLL